MNTRVLMIISQFYPKQGGAEKQCLSLSQALRKNGIQVSVLTRAVAGLPRYEEIKGVPVYRAIRAVPGSKSFSLDYFLSTLWFLLRKRKTYDILHCHILQGFHTPAALVVRALCKKKVVIKVAATGPLSDFTVLKSVRFGMLTSRCLQCADRIVALCTQAVQEAGDEGIPLSKITRIPNGVDTEIFRPQPHPPAGNVIFVGRLDHMKGVHVLLRAFSRVCRNRSHVHLFIVGTGPDRSSLEALANSLGLNSAVTFTGEIDNVQSYLQKSDIFVLPSLSEGMSNVLLEATACGLPVIATRVGGTPEFIQDNENGLLVMPDSADDMHSALLKLLDNPDTAQALGAQARRTAVSRFSIQKTAEQYSSLYRTLTA